jgi:hypothetical protein
MEVHHRLLESVPTYRLRLARLETLTFGFLDSDQALARTGLTTIPVVVHVVYNTAAENISAGQIQSQISVLNRDYRATNPDRKNVPAPWKGLVADARVTFKLATVDPKGKATTGITRTKTAQKSFSAHDEVKASATGGHDAWPTDKYLNIWVCTLGDGLLGYAQFPGGPAKTDGVVILNTAFGTTGTAATPFNGGRSSTHEIGHWLNLRHIWGDTTDCSGTDYCDDTPNAGGPNYGKPKYPHVTCSNGPNGDMFMNYMDYVDDDTMNMFTTQQVARMQVALDKARASIGT